MTAQPTDVAVRLYQVGFGDCFLLTFTYAEKLADERSERHLLVDFGSTRWPQRPAGKYDEIADDVARRTGGQLDAVVLTHRHKDHLGGFGDATAAAKIAALKPHVVLRPWTERPDAVGEDSARLVQGLAAAQEFASVVDAKIPKGARGARGDLKDMADEQLPNRAAVDALDAMAAAGTGLYLHAGQPSGLEELLPGVEVSVLGPPTVEQWPDVASQRASDPEFWLGRRGLLEGMLARAAAPPSLREVAAAAEEHAPLEPGPIRWLVERLREQELHSLLRIVRTLDDALNNTSLVLLFKAGDRRLLFPGDAQIENWTYCLKSEEAAPLREGLDEVELYKVGHHGSRNATPRSLLKLWEPRAGQITSIMSTLHGVHGHSEATAVPRSALVTALKRLGPLVSTEDMGEGSLSVDVTASTSGAAGFAASPPA
ncbi:MAG TPA: MBL fold metallo-hydrolase [Solirubrobacteraceae bacterium]|nr:MBL fold metallo-hydrolase [Solirubrobacteraceae bacterium]